VLFHCGSFVLAHFEYQVQESLPTQNRQLHIVEMVGRMDFQTVQYTNPDLWPWGWVALPMSLPKNIIFNIGIRGRGSIGESVGEAAAFICYFAILLY